MLETAGFALEILTSPSKALRRIQAPDAALSEILRLYILYLIVSVAFYSWKPEGFPPLDPDLVLPPLSAQAHGLFFWIKVQLWEPLMSGIWIVFLAAFAGFFRSSFAKLPVQIALASFAGVIPAVPMILYRRGMIPTFALVLFWIVLLGIFLPYLRSRNKPKWKSLTSIALALNVIDLATVIPVCIAVVLEAPAVYNALHYLILIWTVALGAYLLSRVEGLSTARACVILILSLIWQMLFVFSLHLFGIVPSDTLKAMMSL